MNPINDSTPTNGEDEFNELKARIIDIHKDDWDCIGHSEGQPCCLELLEISDQIMQLIAASNQQAVQKALSQIKKVGDDWLADTSYDIPPDKYYFKIGNAVIDKLAAARPRKDGDENT